MSTAKRLGCTLVGSVALTVPSLAQVPDLLNAFDVGGRSMGSGGAFYATDADTLSGFYNPAGLAYLNRRMVGATYRNLPESRTNIGGTLADAKYSSRGVRGSNAFTHFGYAMPLSEVLKNGTGTLSFAYTVGGYIDDVGRGPNSGLPSGGGAFNVQNYIRRMDARSDYYTIGWAKTNASQNLAYGVSLAYVQQQIGFSETGSATDPSNNPVPFGTRQSSTGNGFGVIVGAQYVNPKSPNMSWGLSYRSEINLSNNDRTSGLYDKIPARLIFGGAYRRDGLRNGNDYLVVGAQVQHFFSGGGSLSFDRDSQSVLGLGVEYNYVRDTARYPIRVGYSALPKGGNGFGSRNSLTYGVGYRPTNGDYGIDLNWGSPQGSGADFSISATYRFK